MFNINWSRSKVDTALSKLQKLNYNQFRWWRLYDAKNKPLTNRHTLRDRILNGDFDLSPYYAQIALCEHTLNDLEEQYFDDYVQFNDKASIWKTRRKRLLEDYEKDEAERLSSLIQAFTVHYRLTKNQVEEKLTKWRGSLIDFYYHIDDKHKIIHQPMPKRRGRPRKL